MESIQQRMRQAAGKKMYEQAAKWRDRLLAIQRIIEKQKVISLNNESLDLVSCYSGSGKTAVNVFQVRGGKLVNRLNFIIGHAAPQPEKNILQAFTQQYYTAVTDKPKLIIMKHPPVGKKLLEKALQIKIAVAQKGRLKHYLNLGEENAKNFYDQHQANWEKNVTRTETALKELQKQLRLKTLPKRIEIYDISNIQGRTAVGSLVVFSNGLPDKKWYRKFKIKTVHGANDPAMMAEVIKRRFQHTAEAKNKNWPKPDLVIVDGGIAQLNASRPHLPPNIDIAALAKKNEEL